MPAKAPKLLIDGEGNLGQIIYGYSKKIEKILDRVEEKFIEYIHREFEQGGPVDDWGHWARLHPKTAEWKAEDGLPGETLKGRGTLEGSFRAERLSKTLIWLGSDDPKAAVHEFGMYIKVTDKMRKFLATRGFPLKKSTTWIAIPERQILRPVLKKLQKDFPEYSFEIMSKLDFKPVKITPV